MLFSFDLGVNWTLEDQMSSCCLTMKKTSRLCGMACGQRHMENKNNTPFFLSIKLLYALLYSISVTLFSPPPFPLVH